MLGSYCNSMKAGEQHVFEFVIRKSIGQRIASTRDFGERFRDFSRRYPLGRPRAMTQPCRRKEIERNFGELVCGRAQIVSENYIQASRCRGSMRLQFRIAEVAEVHGAFIPCVRAGEVSPIQGPQDDRIRRNQAHFRFSARLRQLANNRLRVISRPNSGDLQLSYQMIKQDLPRLASVMQERIEQARIVSRARGRGIWKQPEHEKKEVQFHKRAVEVDEPGVPGVGLQQ